jgi:predicted nucleic acid-binding protein
MVIVDTSAWIEYFRDGVPSVVQKVDKCLYHDLVGIGDLIYCEVVQGIKSKHERDQVSSLLLSLPRYELLGFNIAEKAAENYRLLRSKGITIRKTIDVIIATYCAENDFQLIHYDRDFDLSSSVIGFKVYE